MFRRWYQSLYIKIFLSFLLTCILFFVGLAIFWNVWFSNLFYNEKKQILQSRAEVVSQLYSSYADGTVSSREVRYVVRVIARSFNGHVWIADAKGVVLFSSEPEREAKLIPKTMDIDFARALKNQSGYSIGHINLPAVTKQDSFLTYYTSLQFRGQPVVVFFHTPVDDIVSMIAAVRMNIWLPLLFSLIAVGVILYILSRRLAGPLQQMNQAALALAEGNFLTRVPVSSKDEIGQLAQSFNFMVEKLKQWEDTRQEFLANISHELRSPLTALRGMIVGMNDKVIPQAQLPHYLKICEHEVDRLQGLVNELLDLARIQNSADGFRSLPVDMVQKSRDVIDLIAPAIHEKGLELAVWIPEEHAIRPYPQAVVDPDRYAQILNNLLYNAIQFTPPGKKITVELRTNASEFQICIVDEGIGMSEEETKRVWERFYKADPSRSFPSGGTGLGLTIARHLVLGMGGTISVKSSVGEGSEFVVSFPLLKYD